MTDALTTTEPLYISDADLIRRMGVPRDKGRRMLKALDANPRSGFPKPNPLWGGRRYLPLVLSYLEREERGRLAASPNHLRGSHG
jgi:hypothetical protein